MSALLRTALQKHLEKALQSLQLLGQQESPVQPETSDKVCQVQIFIGDLPPKKAGMAQSHIPFILIVPLDGHQEGGAAVTTLALICVVYNPSGRDSEEAEADLSVLLSSITGALAPLANGKPLDERFELEVDSRGRFLPWVKADSQAQPFLQATMTSTWRYQGWE